MHRELRRKGVTLQLLWMEYKQSHPDGYQYSQFCGLYQQWAGWVDLVMRHTRRAGDKLFVDYAGHTILIYPPGGQVWQAELFVAVLGASNYTYAEAAASQQLECWIGSHVRCLEFLGAVPALLVPDNLRCGVSKSHRYEPLLNRSYQELASHYDTAILPARAAKPRDKAKVEVVQIAERWILASLRNERFTRLAEANTAIAQKLTWLNDRRFAKLEHPEHYGELEFTARLGLLVDRETTERDNRRLARNLKSARLRTPACVEDIDFRQPRGLDRTQTLTWAEAGWVNDHRDLLICGAIGVGKTYLACALAHAAIRRGHRALYWRLPRLLDELRLAHADGRAAHLMASWARIDVLVLDDLGLRPLTAAQAGDLLEVIEDRHQRRSTILTSQLPTTAWHDNLGDPTLADAICDRLLHTAHRVELRGQSLRKHPQPDTTAPASSTETIR